MKKEIKNAIKEIVKNEYDCEPIAVVTPREFFKMTGEDSSEDCLAVALLPGWLVRDEGASIHYPQAEDEDEALEAFVDGGDWGDRLETQFIRCRVGKVALEFLEDEKKGLIYYELIYDDDSYVYELDPIPPPCLDGLEHEWETPHEVLGGLKENPGVWGNGGGVISKEVCRHCAKYRGVDTWAQVGGEAGYRREWYEGADELSRFWVDKLALRKMSEIIEGDKNVKRCELDKYNGIIVEFSTQSQSEYLEHRGELEKRLEKELHRPVYCRDLPDVPKYRGWDCGYELYSL